jgi:hypothetical protein
LILSVYLTNTIKEHSTSYSKIEVTYGLPAFPHTILQTDRSLKSKVSQRLLQPPVAQYVAMTEGPMMLKPLYE